MNKIKLFNNLMG